MEHLWDGETFPRSYRWEYEEIWGLCFGCREVKEEKDGETEKADEKKEEGEWEVKEGLPGEERKEVLHSPMSLHISL